MGTEFYNRFAGRQALLAFAAEKQIPVQQTAAKPWSTDENLFHISYEAGILEDPNTTPPDDMWKLTTAPENAPDAPELRSACDEHAPSTRHANHDSTTGSQDPMGRGRHVWPSARASCLAARDVRLAMARGTDALLHAWTTETAEACGLCRTCGSTSLRAGFTSVLRL